MTSEKMSCNYWVFKVMEETGGLFRRSGIEIYNHRIKDHFWAIKTNPDKAVNFTKIAELKEGDYSVFYLVEKGREGRFLGTANLGSGYRKLDPEEEKRILHKEFLDSNYGVSLAKVDNWPNPLPVDALRGVGAFTGGRSFSQFFEGNIKRLRDQSEFETILQQHKRHSKQKE